MEKIDFVMIWVDGGDPVWRRKKAQYSGEEISESIDDRDSRYRDWDNLRYWFRSVEKYAPWVNKVYFITEGHVPEWLNLDCEKLVHVKHSDYMPPEYLPTFSSHPIELNIHRIPNLSDKVVYFNDDMFLTDYVKPELFFKNGKPVHPPRMYGILPRKNGGVMTHIYVNMTEVINQHFSMRKAVKSNAKKWFNPFKIGFKNFTCNVFNYHYPEFVGFANEHLPVPFLLSTLQEVWNAEPELFDEVSRRKFRDSRDVSQYMFRYWQLATGNFEPINVKKLGRAISIRPTNEKICHAIRNREYKMLCLNDMDLLPTQNDFEKAKQEIIDAFENVLSEKSMFEK